MAFLEDIKKPINIISITIALISVVLSIYFYQLSKSARRPTYLISEDRKQIFDSSISSPNIKVLDSDSAVIQDDIYLMTMTFWNSGKVAIEPEDIRIPIRLKLSNIKKLLDYSVTKQTHPDIINFRITKVSGQSASESILELDWDHLDPNFGVQVQIIYAGDKDIDFSFEGFVLGTGAPINGLSIADKNKFWKGAKAVLGTVGFIFIGVLLNILGNVPKKIKENESVILEITFLVFSVCLILVYFYISRSLQPPL